MILRPKVPFLVDDLADEQRGRGICAFGGGGGGAQSTQTADPYGPARGPLDTVLNTGNFIAQNPSTWPKYYEGSTVAPFTDAQNAALTGTINQATAGSPVTAPTTDFVKNLEGGSYLYNNPAMSGLNSFASGAFTDPTKNPAFADTVTQLTSKTLPGVISKFVTSGNMNNPAMSYAAGQGVTDATAPYLSQMYEKGLDRQLQAINQQGGMYNAGVGQMLQGAQIAPQVQNLSYNDLGHLWQAGLTQQQQNQLGTNADMARWNYNQQEPLSMISWLKGLTGGLTGGTQTSSSGGPDNSAQQAMQAASATAAVGSLALSY